MIDVRFLLFDNSAMNIKTLWNFCEKIKPGAVIVKAQNTKKAIEEIEAHPQNYIIIVSRTFESDGIGFIAKIKGQFKLQNCYFILSSDRITSDTIKRALQNGVENFIEQPYELIQLIPKLKSALDIVSSRIEKAEANKQYMDLKLEFDKEILKLQEIIDIILEKRLPEVADKITLIEKTCIWIAQRYGNLSEIELNNIKLAAKMIYTGRVWLDDKLIKEPIMKDGRLTDPIMKEIPAFTDEILSRIKGYDHVAKVIKSVYENFDGTGFPEGKRAAEIPMQSRILRVVVDFYDTLATEGDKYQTAYEKIEKETNRLYDHYIVAFLDQYFANYQPGRSKNEAARNLKQLTTGEILSRNIITDGGHNLLSSKTTLDDENIAKIRETAKTEGIIGMMYVYDMGETPAETE
jgi:response regulator RpfG family c-di-GMP phosphodiesterase